jgi:hypothetical protein
MGLTFAENAQPICRHCWNLRFRVVLLFVVGLTGCNSACFTFTSNPPTGTIGIKAGDPSPNSSSRYLTTRQISTGASARLTLPD